MAENWQSITELAETPASTDDILIRDISDTTDNAVGTVKRNSRTNFLGSILNTLGNAFMPASAAGPASLALAEDTDNGTNTVSIAAPAAVASNKTATLQDVTGDLYVTGGTDVAVADGGTGVSTLGSGNVLVGAGTSAVTSTKAAPSGDFVGTTDTQTLSAKTLTSPTINAATLTGALDVTGDIALGSGGTISDDGPITATGSLTRATHGGRMVVTSGNVTIPNASGDVGMGGVILLGGAHTITFNSTVTATLASGDLFTYYVQSTTVLVRRLSAASQSVAMS